MGTNGRSSAQPDERAIAAVPRPFGRVVPPPGKSRKWKVAVAILIALVAVLGGLASVPIRSAVVGTTYSFGFTISSVLAFGTWTNEHALYPNPQFCLPPNAVGNGTIGFVWNSEDGTRVRSFQLWVQVGALPQPFQEFYNANDTSAGGFAFVATHTLPCQDDNLYFSLTSPGPQTIRLYGFFQFNQTEDFPLL